MHFKWICPWLRSEFFRNYSQSRRTVIQMLGGQHVSTYVNWKCFNIFLVSSCCCADLLYLLDSISLAEVDVRVRDAVRELEPCPHQSSTHSLHDIRSAIMETSVFIIRMPPCLKFLVCFDSSPRRGKQYIGNTYQ